MPPAITLLRWVNEDAFVVEAQTRPCPTFGRPVHPGITPRLRPGTSPHALRIPLTVDTLPSEALQAVALALGCIQLSLSCPFRRLHTFCLLRPARNYSRFWIWRPSFERQRDFNPPGRRAAQHALRVLRLGLLQDGGYRGRFFHCGFWSRCVKNLFWHCFASDSNPLNSGVPRSLTSDGSVCKAV